MMLKLVLLSILSIGLFSCVGHADERSDFVEVCARDSSSDEALCGCFYDRVKKENPRLATYMAAPADGPKPQLEPEDQLVAKTIFQLALIGCKRDGN